MFYIEVHKLQEGVYEQNQDIKLEMLGLLPGNQLWHLCEGQTCSLSSLCCPQ